MKLQATSSNDKLEATSSRGCCFDDPDGPDPKWTGEDEHDVEQDWNCILKTSDAAHEEDSVDLGEIRDRTRQTRCK